MASPFKLHRCNLGHPKSIPSYIDVIWDENEARKARKTKVFDPPSLSLSQDPKKKEEIDKAVVGPAIYICKTIAGTPWGVQYPVGILGSWDSAAPAPVRIHHRRHVRRSHHDSVAHRSHRVRCGRIRLVDLHGDPLVRSRRSGFDQRTARSRSQQPNTNGTSRLPAKHPLRHVGRCRWGRRVLPRPVRRRLVDCRMVQRHSVNVRATPEPRRSRIGVDRTLRTAHRLARGRRLRER